MSTATTQTIAPPVVHITPDVFYSERGHEAYNTALDSASVIAVPRSGRTEYIIDHKHAYDVLTDAKNFIFDKGVVKMLHMEFMLWFKNGTFVTELDGLVTTTVQTRLGVVIEQLEPLLQQSFAEQFHADTTGNRHVAVSNVFERTQNVIALAMTLLICGYDHVSPRMVNRFVATTNATAKLSGFYAQIDGWPVWSRGIYHFWSTISSICVIFWHLTGILPDLWRSRHSHRKNGLKKRSTEFTPLFDYLLANHWSEEQSGMVGFGNFLWCSIATIGIIFASIHQTVVVAVWVMVELTRRQDVYLEQIRTEWKANIKTENNRPIFRTQDLNRLHYLDSFIREVMRTKGDAFAPVRFSTRDVQVGNYVVPANSICLPYVHRAHGHPDNYGDQGAVFDGFRWVNSGRPAVQGNESFLSFGVGRWACPGRHLAVAEIKILVYMLFEHFNVNLDEDSFEILDLMNTTSVPPKATLNLSRKVSTLSE